MLSFHHFNPSANRNEQRHHRVELITTQHSKQNLVGEIKRHRCNSRNKTRPTLEVQYPSGVLHVVVRQLLPQLLHVIWMDKVIQAVAIPVGLRERAEKNNVIGRIKAKLELSHNLLCIKLAHSLLSVTSNDNFRLTKVKLETI